MNPSQSNGGAGESLALDPLRTAELMEVMTAADFKALATRLPNEIDTIIGRVEHAIRANDIDGVRVALRALHDAAAQFGLRELAALSARLAAETADLAQVVEHTGAMQNAIEQAKAAIGDLLATSRVSNA